MTKNSNILLIGAALLMLAGCTVDELAGSKDGQIPVRLSVSQEATVTRAADGLYTNMTGFDGGEQVEVYVNSSDKHATFTVGAPDGDKKSELTGTLYYPTSGDANLYAVYPAASTESHTVKYDQTTEENYKASDLMYAKTTVAQADKENTQNLQFNHQLVKLKVVIVKAADVSQVTQVMMNNVKRQVSVTLGPSSMTLGTPATATGDEATGGDNILVFSGSNTLTSEQTYAVVFPVQSWSNQDFITVTADGKTATYKLTKDNFAAGSEYTLTLNINATALNNTVSITNWTGNEGSCEVQPTVTEKQYVFVPEGAIPGLFTINADGDQVFFSKGNLQATTTDNGSSWTWSFAEHQWDYIGDAAKTPSDNGNILLTETSPFISGNGTVDLFGWVGASSTWTGVNMYGITSSNATGNKDGYGDTASESLRSDWGALPISNGGNSVYSGWRTLTSDEWEYLFRTRTVNGGTGSGKSYTLGQSVGGVLGVVIYPDGYTGSVYAGSDWATFESAGCVFLPAAGYRNGTTVDGAGSDGNYWSSTANPSIAHFAYLVYFSGYLSPDSYYNRDRGYSVRLVRDVASAAPAGAEAVDLGLPSGTKWANMNVGATSVTDYGDYFAWGETEPYYSSQSPSVTWKTGKTAGYDWASYQFTTDGGSTFTKYTSGGATLEATDDAARANWRGSWRMPTEAEFNELLSNTNKTEYFGDNKYNGANGILLTSKTDNTKSIFLPAAGMRYDTSVNNVGSRGYYWLSTLLEYDPGVAGGLSFESEFAGVDYIYYRCGGLSVRPVQSN